MAAIDVSSDSDDDSIIVIPYVKPAPPTIVLADSDQEEEEVTEPTVQENSVNTNSVNNSVPIVIDICNEDARADAKNGNNKKSPEKQSSKNKHSKEDENCRTIKNSNSEPSSSKVNNNSHPTTRPLTQSGTSDNVSNNSETNNIVIVYDNSNSGTVARSSSRPVSQSSPSTSGPPVGKNLISKQNENSSRLVPSGTPNAPKANRKSGAPTKAQRPTYNYTLTPAQKRKYPHLEKILHDLQIEKQKKRAQEERLKQLKISQGIKKSNVADNSKSSRMTGQPSPKKKSKRDTTSLTAADLDHLHFLKTLNLTAGIGFDEGDIRALAKTRKSHSEELLNTPTSSASATENVVNSAEASLAIGTGIQLQQQEATNNIIPAAFVSIVDESLGKNVKTKSTKKHDRSANSSSPTTSSPIVSVSSDKEKVEHASLGGQIIEATTIGPSTAKASSSSTAKTSPSSTAKASPSSTAKASPSSTQVNNAVVDLSADDDENQGIFTHAELIALQSNIHLNITGSDVQNSFHQPKSNSESKNTLKRPFRYFHDPSSTSFDTGESSSEDEVGNHVTPPRSNVDGSKISSRVNDEKVQSPHKSPKNNLSQDRDKSSKHSSKRKRMNNNQNANSSRRLPAFESIRSARQDAVERELAKLINVSSVKELKPNARQFPKNWSRKMIEYYGTLYNENLDLDDVFRGQSNSPRLWLTPLDPDYRRRKGRQFKCTNCNQFGDHSAARCPEPRRPQVCVMCGNLGHTTSCLYINSKQNDEKSKQWGRFTITRCSQANCLNCGRNFFNNRASNMKSFTEFCDGCSPTSISDRRIKCRCCGLEGHADYMCPDNWRRFHSTLTDPGENNAGDPNVELQKTLYKSKKEFYCANCGEQGHQYFHCRGKRDYNTHTPFKPYIIRELPLCLQAKPVEIVEDDNESNQDKDKNSTYTPEFNAKSRTVRRQDGMFEVQVIYDSTEQVRA